MITVRNTVRIGTVWFKSGHYYQFYYANYESDPVPVIILLNHISGTHPKTGKKHNFIQAINLTYIPRQFRRLFVEHWSPTLENNKGNTILTWKMVLRKFPYLQFAMRRYIVDRNFIKYQREIKNEDIPKIVISSFSRDFSISGWKAMMKLRAGKKGGVKRLNVAKKTLSRNRWFSNAIGGPI